MTAPAGGRPASGPAATAVATLALVVVGGIDLAAHLPRHPSLAVPVGLLAAAVVLLAANALRLARLRPFAWHTFRLVGVWTLAAYLVIGGMLEYIFVLDHTRGGVLAVLTGMLVVFAVDVPFLLAYSVARFQPVRPPGPG